MKNKKQSIEEMTRLLWHFPKSFNLNCYNDCEEVASILYDEEYMKPSVAEWENLKKTNYESLNLYNHICSSCKCVYTDTRPYGHKFCHNCGSKMKGETE